MSEQLTTVRLLGRLQIPGGAMLNARERCILAADVAEDLISRGAAEPIQQESKAPDRPPADKMIHFGPVRKGDKR